MPLHATKTVLFEWQSYIDSIEKNFLIFEENNFERRAEVIEALEFRVINQIEELPANSIQRNQLNGLKDRAEKIKADLEAINNSLFQKLRTRIQTGMYTGKAFKGLIASYFNFDTYNAKDYREEPGYDHLDILINGIMPFKKLPLTTKELEPEMIYYQKTPARIIFGLTEQFQFKKEDVFVDLGAGLGQPVILVNLLCDIKTRGIEFEPQFCEYARGCARELGLSNIDFVNVDAREANYSEGTVFFMFTPFKGAILQAVLDRLREESLSRTISLVTYGPCTIQVAEQDWLDCHGSDQNNIYTPTIFRSR